MKAVLVLFGTLLILAHALPASAQQGAVPDAQPWWVNSPESPLEIWLPPRKDRLFLSNRSTSAISDFSLACISQKGTRIKVHKVFETQLFSAPLEPAPASGGTRFAESIDDKFMNPRICKKGKLAVFEARNAEKLVYRLVND